MVEIPTIFFGGRFLKVKNAQKTVVEKRNHQETSTLPEPKTKVRSQKKDGDFPKRKVVGKTPFPSTVSRDQMLLFCREDGRWPLSRPIPLHFTTNGKS